MHNLCCHICINTKSKFKWRSIKQFQTFQPQINYNSKLHLRLTLVEAIMVLHSLAFVALDAIAFITVIRFDVNNSVGNMGNISEMLKLGTSLYVGVCLRHQRRRFRRTRTLPLLAKISKDFPNFFCFFSSFINNSLKVFN